MLKIITGGQTGVDRAALDVALELGFPTGGWCPRGRRAEDGEIPSQYSFRETDSEEYLQRTEWNIRDSDGTLVLTLGPPTNGTELTIDLARRAGKPLRVLDLESHFQLHEVLDWIANNRLHVLNVAGPRESFRPGKVYAASSEILKLLLKLLQDCN